MSTGNEAPEIVTADAIDQEDEHPVKMEANEEPVDRELEEDVQPGPTQAIPSKNGSNGQEPNEAFINERQGRVHVRMLPAQGNPGPQLVKALCEARKKIKTVPRSGWNDYLKAKHATHDDVTAAAGPALAEAGVWVFPTVREVRYTPAPDAKPRGIPEPRPQYRCVMVMETTWTDGNTSWTSQWSGSSIDSQATDKHEYQVYSQIMKYALAKTLLIDTGDPDVDAAKPNQPEAQEQAAKPTNGAHKAPMRGSPTKVGGKSSR